LAAARRLCDMASVGFSGSSIRMTSAPRPVSTPPTEVAMRKPPRVVKSSAKGSRGDASLVGNSERYHSEVMIARQSRANFSERSWA